VRCAAARACGDEFERRRVTHGRTAGRRRTHANAHAGRIGSEQPEQPPESGSSADMGHAESSMQ
jgi:hypothetical protein